MNSVNSVIHTLLIFNEEKLKFTKNVGLFHKIESKQLFLTPGPGQFNLKQVKQKIIEILKFFKKFSKLPYT